MAMAALVLLQPINALRICVITSSRGSTESGCVSSHSCLCGSQANDTNCLRRPIHGPRDDGHDPHDTKERRTHQWSLTRRSTWRRSIGAWNHHDDIKIAADEVFIFDELPRANWARFRNIG